MKKSWLALLCIILLVPLSVNATEELSIRQQYDAYEERFMAIERYEDVESNGFRLMEGQLFQECFESFGTQTLTFFAAMDEKYNRLALFLMDEEGKILFKTNQLETNYQIHGEMTQITTEIAAVSFWI